MLQFADFQDRIGCMRPDRLPREWQIAFQIAARRVCEETFALQQQVQFTMPLGDTSQELLFTDENGVTMVSVYIFKAQYQDEQGRWNALNQLNQAKMRDHTHAVTPQQGVMRGFTSEMGRFVPDHPPSVDTQVQVLAAFKPVGDFDLIDLGPDFEDVLVAGALSHLLRLPGAERNIEHAGAEEAKFIAMASGLRGTTLVGDVGYARASRSPRRRRLGLDLTNVLTY